MESVKNIKKTLRFVILFLPVMTMTTCSEEGKEDLVEGLQEVAGIKVDLRDEQTDLRNQGNRNTCITFAATAAMEAAYKRAGYGDINLSEEFMNYFGKTFWLHPKWDEIAASGEDAWESQTGLFSGGGGVGYLEFITRSDFKIPREENMPYRTAGYPESEYPMAQYAWNDDYWNLQKRRSDFNLDPRNITDSVLKASAYYDIQSFRVLDPVNPAAGARNTKLIEQALKDHQEVVWDFQVARNFDGDSLIWRPCEGGVNSCVSGAHSMLIVGFDKTSEDSSMHHFIVKNSWGKNHWTTQDDGYTYISYDYVRKYGYNAGYIEAVRAPKPWKELGFVGRWKLNRDGWRGTLDIYHIPGIRQYFFDQQGNGYDDWRVGSFYDNQGNAYKVNGYMQGNKITFWLDFENHNIPWDVFNEGTELILYRSTDFDQNLMAGFHTLEDGRTYTSYARKEGFLPSGQPTSASLSSADAYIGTWELVVGGETKGTLQLSQTTTGSGTVKQGIYTEDGSSGQYEVTWDLKDNADTHSSIELRVIFSIGNYYDLYGKHMSWEDGLVTGYATMGSSGMSNQPFYMIRQ